MGILSDIVSMVIDKIDRGYINLNNNECSLCSLVVAEEKIIDNNIIDNNSSFEMIKQSLVTSFMNYMEIESIMHDESSNKIIEDSKKIKKYISLLLQ